MDCDRCEVLKRVAEDLEVVYARGRGLFTELSARADSLACNRVRGWLNEVWLNYELARVEYQRHQGTHAESPNSDAV